MSRVDNSGGYPTIVSEPDGKYFAREAEADEFAEFPWIVINFETGEHIVETHEDEAGDWVDRLNAGASS